MTVVRWMGVLALALAVGGCGTDQVSSEVLTGTAVITYRDPAAIFGAYQTYAITDKLTVYREVDGQPVYTFVAAPEILAAIETNMAERGYLLVARIDPVNPPPVPPDADLAINPIVLEGTRYAYYPCDWWSWWALPGSGCYLPWEWVPYRTGTLLMPLADLRNPPPPGPQTAFSILWAGAGYAVLTPSNATNVQIGVKAVNQAFAQSPYLRTP